MVKTKINALINILMAVSFLFSAISGFSLLILPKGGFYGGRNLDFGKTLFSLSRHDYLNIHNFSSIILVVLIIIHLLFHLSYIKNLGKILKE